MIWASYVEPISSRHSPIQTYFLLLPLWLSLAVLLLCQIFTSVVNKVEKCIYLSFCSTSCKLLSRIMLMFYSKVLHALSSFISGHATLCRVSWGTELLRSAVVNQIRDPVEWWLRFLLLRCVSRIGSSCVSAAITVHPFVPKPDWCIFRPLAFLIADLATMASCFCYPSIQFYLTYPFHSHWLVPVCFQLCILLSFLSFSSHRRL